LEKSPDTVCYFDYEAIEKPTKAIIHQSARFWYFRKGKGILKIDDTTYELKPNTIVSIAPWKITEIVEVEETLQFIKLIYDFQFINQMLKGATGLEKDSAELFKTIDMEPVLHLDSVQAQEIETILEKLKEEIGVASYDNTNHKPLRFLYMTNKMTELLITYHRYMLAKDGNLSQRPEKPLSLLSYIYAHSSERLTLDKLASVFYMSASSIAKQLNALTGTGFAKLLTEMRIAKVSDYLIYTDLTLSEIAYLTGFVDASHLSKNFNAKVDVTPIRYRKIYSHVRTNFNKTDKEIAYSVIDFLYKNYNDNELSGREVAAKFGISLGDLNMLLIYYCEKDFDNLLNFIRINKACELLSSTQAPILQIAIDVGYNNAKTFNLNFYKFMNRHPSDFRKKITFQADKES